MADDQKQQESQGNQEPPQEPAKQQEPPKAQEPPAEPAGDVKDSHGQPGINKERHDREVAELKGTIEKLQKQLAEQAETKEGRDKLQKELDEVRAQMADSEVSHKLEMAGCLNAKAAKALLGDYDGDVEKLKAEAPYLFAQEKQKGSTGAKPAGAADGLDDKLDRAMGLKKK